MLTGPSGVGKGTIVQALLKRHPQLWLSVSATTRPPRSGEVDGKDYRFMEREAFKADVASGGFLEWAEFAGNCYGTPLGPIEAQLKEGRPVLLEIEVEGARQVRERLPHAVQVFLQPPSLAALEARLRGRRSESERSIQQRLARAEEEMARGAEFDHVIVNDDLAVAIQKVGAVLTQSLGERSRPAEQREGHVHHTLNLLSPQTTVAAPPMDSLTPENSSKATSATRFPLAHQLLTFAALRRYYAVMREALKTANRRAGAQKGLVTQKDKQLMQLQAEKQELLAYNERVRGENAEMAAVLSNVQTRVQQAGKLDLAIDALRQMKNVVDGQVTGSGYLSTNAMHDLSKGVENFLEAVEEIQDPEEC